MRAVRLWVQQNIEKRATDVVSAVSILALNCSHLLCSHVLIAAN